MNDDLFDQPVYVRDGMYRTREIASVSDAIDYLEEWPDNRRDLRHETVLDACYSVLVADKPVAAVEKAFVCLAKKAGVLEAQIDGSRARCLEPNSSTREARP